MKQILVILFNVVLCLCQNKDEVWADPAEEECIQKLLINRDHIDSVLSNYTPGNLPDDDEEFLKFDQCRAASEGIQNDDGSINFEKLKLFLKDFDRMIYGKESGSVGEKLASEAVDSCKNVDNKGVNAKRLVQVQNCIDVYLSKVVKKN